MKRIKIVVLSLLLLCVTGCMDFNAEMEIRRDKSMTLSIMELVDNDLVKSDLPYFSDEDVKKYKESGFSTSNYIVDDRVGHLLTKEFTNIDTVSTTDQLQSKLATKNLLENDQPIFTVKKGVFVNKYYATFNVSDFVSVLNVDDSKLRTASLDFTLTLPYKAMANNATETLNHGKKLVWNLNDLKTDQIYFEFKLYNLTNVYIVAGGVFLMGLLILSERRDKKIAKGYYKKKSLQNR